jgi:outer membrane protein
MRKYRTLLARVLLASTSAWAASPAASETLQEALTKAYRNNPTLTGERANQRARDEEVGIVKADGRPAADISANYSQQLHRDFPLTTPRRSGSAQAQLNVPLYNGGTIRNAIKAAKLRVEAGQNNLRGTEASIFSRVVAAYMDVIRDSAVVRLNTQNTSALEVNLRASSDRFQVGDLTRTDVAQSESRLALAQAQLQRAQSQLIASKENYTALVGSPPVNLEGPPELPGLPDSPETAVAIALSDNPDIRQAQKARDAARYDVKSAEGRIAPRISGFVTGSYQDFFGSDRETFVGYSRTRSAAAGGSLTLPLYQGGRPGAAQRQAVARESSAIEDSILVERDVISQVRAAYAARQASLSNIESTAEAVRAAELSLNGVKAENSVGARTILDILNAEQEALNASVQLVTARRDAYVAAFSLLASMGHAEARDLNIDSGNQYDPTLNYRRVSGKLLDFDFSSRPTAVASPTTQTLPQDASPLIIPGY